MRSPLVSIFLSTFNHAHFVEESIRSAVEQDYPHLQVVVGDDGSTDGTAEIIQRLAEEMPDRIAAIVGQPHLGVAGNFNRILGACRGDLVAFLSGDDRYLPGKIRIQVAHMLANPASRLSCHDVEVFDSRHMLVRGTWQERNAKVAVRPDSLVKFGNPFHPLGTMVLRSAIPESGFDVRLPVANDWKFFVDCCGGTAAFSFLDGVYARYRVWEGNVSRREEEMHRDLLATLDLVGADYPWLAKACRFRRAKMCYDRGRAALRHGDIARARILLTASLRARLVPTRIPLALAAVVLPAQLCRVLMQRAEAGPKCSPRHASRHES